MKPSILAAAIALAAFGAAHAQTYPAKPIRMIVPFAPGGPNDIISRIVGQKLTTAMRIWNSKV